MRFNFACICGAHWQGNVDQFGYIIISQAWNNVHGYGGGHAKCTPREAGRIRVKLENRRLKEKKANP